MKPISAAEVRDVVVNLFRDSIEANDLDPDALPDDCDLLELGVIDSLGIVNMVALVNETVGGEIDFEGLDFEHMTVLNKFCNYVEDYAKRHAVA